MKKALKIFLYILGSIFALIVLVFIWINSNWGQNVIRKQAVSFLEKKLQTEVKIGNIDFSLPYWVKLEDVFLRDRNKDTLASIGLLRVDISMLKLINSEIEVQNLVLENTYVNLYRNYPDTSFNFDFIAQSFSSGGPKEPKQKKDSTTKINLDVEHISLNHIRFNFLDHSGGVQFRISLDSLRLTGKKTNINDLAFHVKDVMIAGVRSSVVIDTSIIPPDPDTTSKSNPLIIVDNLDMSRVNFILNDAQKPRTKEGIDYAHLDIRDVAIQASTVYYMKDSISGLVAHIAAKEQSGIDIQELKTDFVYYSKGASLKDLYFKTSHTLLQDHLAISYSSLDALKNNLGEMQLTINLAESVVGLEDVLIFAPDLKKQDLFKNHSTEQFDLEADIAGALKSLNIANLYLAGLTNTVVQVNGKLNGLPEEKDIFYDLKIPVIRSTREDLMAFIPKKATADIDLPDNFELKGKISGTTLDYNPDILLVSTDGSVMVNGYIHMSGGKGREQYKLAVSTDKFNIGKILKQDSVLGRVTAKLYANGTGFDVNTMNASVRGEIAALWAMGYNYHHLDLKGNIAEKLANIDMVAEDPNARLQLNAIADLNKEYPALRGYLEVDTINLHALKFSSDSLALRTCVHFDIPSLNPDYPYGDVTITETGVDANNKRFFIDSLFIAAKSSADSGQNISVNAIFLQAQLTGQIPLTKTGVFIQNNINKYYPISPGSSKDTLVAGKSYNLDLDATIIDRPVLHNLLPGLKTLSPVTLHAAVSDTNLAVLADIPNMNYNDMFIDSGKVRINNTNDSTLSYAVTVDNFSKNTLQLWYSSITGDVQQHNITADVKIKDIEKEDRFGLSALLTIDSSSQTLSLQKDLLLNYKQWAVNPGNKITFGGNGLYIDSFEIKYGNGSVTLQSEEQKADAPLNVNINNFQIATITELLQQDTLVANGLLNSKLRILQPTTNMHATGNLTIDGLAVMGDTVGDLNVDLTEASASEVATSVTLKGQGNDILVKGSYYAPPREMGSFNMKIDINSLDMANAEGFAMKQLRNSSGSLKGNFTMTGTPDKPIINGVLETDSFKTTVVFLGATFTMPDEKIKVSDDKIEFQKFRLVDEAGNKGVIGGDVDITELTNPKLNLAVESRNWQAVNSTKKENELFYGRVLLSSNLKITGTPAAPSIEGNLTIHDSTDFTIVVPERLPGIQEREGVVEFVDRSAPPGYQEEISDTIPRIAMRAGTDLNLNVAIEKNAQFNILIDQASGDLLRVKGEANLNTQINPDGTIGLAGVYSLNDGSYEMNYSLVKRRFQIQPGSEIKFAGDPLKAEVDITAAYIANIPPYELVQNEIDEQSGIYYKQRLPFSVVLKLTGQILEPEVNFDITLPEERKYRANSEVVTIVQGKLTQLRNNPSEMNKQVFAALILNKFLASDPFQSLGGTSAEYVARQSASRFVSAQLNKMAEEFVNGLEINLDLQSTEDYTTGEKRNRTDFNVSATKRLFNDRLSVTVGNNFEVEGAAKNSNNNSNIIPGNLAADYHLSKDGRYLVRIFRRRDNINIVEGISVETGVSFVVSLDYDRFRNLFMKKETIQKEETDINADKQGGTN